jgi:hypothetical protein
MNIFLLLVALFALPIGPTTSIATTDTSRACVCTNPEFRARHLIREYMCFSPSEVVAMERVEGSIFPDH